MCVVAVNVDAVVDAFVTVVVGIVAVGVGDGVVVMLVLVSSL